MSQSQEKIRLVDVDISHCRIDLADMVSGSRDTEAFASDVSVSASRFSAGVGVRGLAVGPGRLGAGIEKGEAQLYAEAISGGLAVCGCERCSDLGGY